MSRGWLWPPRQHPQSSLDRGRCLLRCRADDPVAGFVPELSRRLLPFLHLERDFLRFDSEHRMVLRLDEDAVPADDFSQACQPSFPVRCGVDHRASVLAVTEGEPDGAPVFAVACLLTAGGPAMDRTD